MDRTTKQQILDLALVVLRDLERVESSIDQILLETRACRQQFLTQRQFLLDASQVLSKVSL